MKQQMHDSVNRVVILTSDEDRARVFRFSIKKWIWQGIIILLCLIIGALIGYFIFENKVWQSAMEKTKERNEYTRNLENENKHLQSLMDERESTLNRTIDELEEEVKILSNTLNEKVENETKLVEELNKQSLPTEFPLSGAAAYKMIDGEQPICELTPSQTTAVIATAKGIVIAVNEDLEYGKNVWVDHGNGYITIYRNKGNVVVKQGDNVVKGTTLFILTDAKEKLGYQMLLNGEYISPIDMMQING